MPGCTHPAISQYEYDALGQRIMETKGGTNAKWRFVYDDRWRIVATMRGIDTNPKERLVPHNAGLDGRGGSSYIDTYAFQERDNATSGGGPNWDATSDGTLEDKHYFVQNWRADVVNLVAPSGETLAWTRYTAYGEQQQVLRADTTDGVTAGKRDGGIGIEDLLQYSQWNEDGVDEADFDDGSGIGIPDGGVGIEDLLYYLALFEGGGITVPTRLGYAGYVKDVFAEAAAVTAPIYHVRHRVYNAELGRWTRRDPLGYVDGMGLTAFASPVPDNTMDPSGLISCSIFGCTLTSGKININCSCAWIGQNPLATPNTPGLWIIPEGSDPPFTAPRCGVDYDADGFAINGVMYKISNGCCINIYCNSNGTYSYDGCYVPAAAAIEGTGFSCPRPVAWGTFGVTKTPPIGDPGRPATWRWPTNYPRFRLGAVSPEFDLGIPIRVARYSIEPISGVAQHARQSQRRDPRGP